MKYHMQHQGPGRCSCEEGRQVIRITYAHSSTSNRGLCAYPPPPGHWLPAGPSAARERPSPTVPVPGSGLRGPPGAGHAACGGEGQGGAGGDVEGAGAEAALLHAKGASTVHMLAEHATTHFVCTAARDRCSVTPCVMHASRPILPTITPEPLLLQAGRCSLLLLHCHSS